MSGKTTWENGKEGKTWNSTSMRMKIVRYRGKSNHDFDECVRGTFAACSDHAMWGSKRRTERARDPEPIFKNNDQKFP